MANPALTVDPSAFPTNGRVRLTWTNANKGANWYSWRVYRRDTGGYAWTLLKEYLVDQANYTFDDYLAKSNAITKNLIPNSSFELPVVGAGLYVTPDSWTQMQSGSITLAAGGATPVIGGMADGNQGLRIQISGAQTTNSWVGYRTSNLIRGLVAGQTIQLSWYENSAFTNSQRWVQIDFEGASGTISTVDLKAGTVAGPVRQTATAVVPAGTTGVYIYVLVQATNSSNGSCDLQVDGIQLEVGSTTTTYAPAVSQDYIVVRTFLSGGVPTEEAYTPTQAVSPASTNYWLVHPFDTTQVYILYIVNADKYSIEQDIAEMQVIGRGRKVDEGTVWGIKGTLSCQLRDNATLTAKQQLANLTATQQTKFWFWLRDPFGYMRRVVVSNLQVDRLAGVGLNEYSNISFDYSEIAA